MDKEGEKMEDLKKMSIKELATRMLTYINEIEDLENMLCEYLDKRDKTKLEKIKQEYKKIKINLNDEYKYFNKVANSNMYEISLVHNCYQFGITEASVKGLSVKTNGSVDQMMLNAVLDASFYLKYYMSKEDLQKYSM